MQSDEARAPSSLADKTVLVVGAGGIGAPLGLALVRSGVEKLVVCDDDRVERSNLHRQILFGEGDVGREKLEAYGAALARIEPRVQVELVRSRLLPDTALQLVERADVVVDATDNFASRFLIADACKLRSIPAVHAASVRWTATAIATGPRGAPCYRCLFEDLPEGNAPDCATAGVLGPVCGVAGALAADLVLRILEGAGGARSPHGFIFTYDGRSDRLRKVAVRRRLDCSLCGERASIADLAPDRYLGPACADA